MNRIDCLIFAFHNFHYLLAIVVDDENQSNFLMKYSSSSLIFNDKYVYRYMECLRVYMEEITNNDR